MSHIYGEPLEIMVLCCMYEYSSQLHLKDILSTILLERVSLSEHLVQHLILL